MNIREGKEIKKNYYTVGMLIRMGRNQAGLSQGELAKATGVSETTLSKWETDATTPSAKNLRKLEAILKMAKTCGLQEPPVVAGQQHAEEKQGMDTERLQKTRAMIALLDTSVQQLKLLMGEIDRSIG